MKTMFAFDLDGTLAASKQAIEGDMATILADLLDRADVAVISGGDWPQFEKQVIGQLPERANTDRLFILPTSGTKLYRHQAGEWTRIYAHEFSAEERDRIVASLKEASQEAGYDKEQTWGEQIEDRGSQITYSALGQQAPLDAKEHWDPDFAKRKKLQAILRTKLPKLAINVGGSTSIDITHEGIDKAYGMRQLAEHSDTKFEAMLFFGDAIYEGGNDYAVKAAGIDSIRVRDSAETATALRAVTYCLPKRD